MNARTTGWAFVPDIGGPNSWEMRDLFQTDAAAYGFRVQIVHKGQAGNAEVGADHVQHGMEVGGDRRAADALLFQRKIEGAREIAAGYFPDSRMRSLFHRPDGSSGSRPSARTEGLPGKDDLPGKRGLK